MRLTAQNGFSLIEALTATVIAVFAVLGLAYTFGMGSALVNRYEVARAALGEAENRMERLLLLSSRNPRSDSLRVGYASPPSPFTLGAGAIGTVWWHVDPYDDPVVPGSHDMNRVVVCVRWNASIPDSVQLDQLVLVP